MPQPIEYTRSYDFTDYQANYPSNPIPAAPLDANLDLVGTSVNQIVNRLKLIQRDDGLFKNKSVTLDSLSNTVVALMGSSLNPLGDWVTATAYEKMDLVEYQSVTYICSVDHTSGTFLTDKNAGKWLTFSNPAIDEGEGFYQALSGNGVATAFVVSNNLGSDSKGLIIFHDDGNGVRNLVAPTLYTIDGTDLTFIGGFVPANGSGNIHVLAPSLFLAAASAAASTAEAASATASGFADDAKDWAVTAEDTEVTTGLYSSLHYAAKSAASAVESASQATKLTGTSTTSVAIGTGSKVFTTQADKDFNGNNVRVFSDADPANYMDGLASYSGTTLTVTVSAIGGSGTFTDWTIRVNGARGATGAAGIVADGDKGDIAVSDSGTVMTLQPDAISGQTEATPEETDTHIFERAGVLYKAALSAIIAVIVGAARNFTGAQTQTRKTLTDGATITPDFSLGNNFNVVLGGNRTLGMPSNLVADAAQSFNIDFVQDATGSRTLGYAWGYHFSGGTAPVLSTAGCSTDTLYGDVKVYKQSAVTITIATPGVVSYTAHGLVTGQRVQLTTTGALPTGLATGTSYYVIVKDVNSFWLATSLANAAAGTKIATSGSQSGVHTLTACRINVGLGIKGAA